MICIQVLPYDSYLSKEYLSAKKGNCVKSLEELIVELRRSNGNPDKPVRILKEENGQVLMAKFGLGDDLQRQPCVEDELENYRLLSKLSLPHVASFVWGGKTLETGLLLPTVVTCIEFIFPFFLQINSNIFTLRQLAEKGSTILWKQALFQTIFTLAQLQQHFPGFRHNDFKADNILVTNSQKDSVCYSAQYFNNRRRVWSFDNLKVWAKVIDFELACTPSSNIKSRAVLTENGGNLEHEYGLSKNRCDYFDIHLLSFDVLTSSRNNPQVYDEFKQFITQYIPERYFLLENLTSQCRLKIEDQKNHSKKHILLEMLANPYFHLFRDYSDSEADFSILQKIE